MMSDEEDEEVHFGFAEQVETARNGWLQGRYYSEEGDTVADVLSFRNVFEINPFVVGVSYARERRVYVAWPFRVRSGIGPSYAVGRNDGAAVFGPCDKRGAFSEVRAGRNSRVQNDIGF